MKKTKCLVKNNNTKINLWFNGDSGPHLNALEELKNHAKCVKIAKQS